MNGTSRLDDLKAYIRDRRWRWQPGKPIAYGEQIIVLAGNDTASVNFYPKSGKLVTGGAKSPLKDALDAWITGDIEPPEDVAKDEIEPVEAMFSGFRLDELKCFIQQ